MGRGNASKLRDKAAKLVEKRKYDKAVTVYHDLEGAEPHKADWSKRAGDCYRRLEQNQRAVEAFTRAADKYAKAGFLVKAVAVCKMILAVDPGHTEALEKLAELQRERGVPHGAQAAPRRPAKAGSDASASRSFGAVVDTSTGKPPTSAPAAAPPPGQQRQRPAPAPDRAAAASRPAPPPPPASAPSGPSGPEAPPAHLVSRDSRRFGLDQKAEGKRTLPPGAALDSISLADIVPDSREVQGVGGARSGIFEIPIEEGDLIFEEGEVQVELAEPAGGPLAVAATAADVEEPDFDIEFDVDGPAVEGTHADQAARAVLPRTPLFSDLSPAALQLIIGSVELVELEAGEAVFRQGDAADAFYVVSEGTVAAIDEGPPRVQLGTIEEGQFFGEIGVVSDQPRNATVEAVCATELLKIQRDVVGDLVEAEPAALNVMLRFLRDRLIDNLVRTSPLFEPFQGAERASLASRFKFLEVDSGAELIEAGQRASGLYVLLTGRTEVARDSDGGRERLATLGPGDIFGEMSLLSGEPAVASVRAISKCFALELPGDVFREVIMTHPQVLMFVGDLAEQRRRQNKSIATGDEDYTEGRLDLF